MTGSAPVRTRRWRRLLILSIAVALAGTTAAWLLISPDETNTIAREAAGMDDAAPGDGLLCNGYADLCDRPFDRTVFAGTHNSMAADRAWGIVALPVTTQKYTIREQLDRGIRALSLDTWYGRDIGVDVVNASGPTRKELITRVEPYLCHSYCTFGATRLEDGFRDVVSFLKVNPNEVVIIYFEDYVSVADTAAVVQSSGLAPYVFNWSGEPQPHSVTLRQLIEADTRVVMVSQNVSPANQTPWYPRLTTVGIDTDYAFTSAKQLTDPANLATTCRPTPWGRTGTGSVFLMQHFITDVIASKKASGVVNTQETLVRRALACRDARGTLPTILLVDFFELPAGDGGVLGATRALNDLTTSG